MAFGMMQGAEMEPSEACRVHGVSTGTSRHRERGRLCCVPDRAAGIPIAARERYRIEELFVQMEIM